jgi:diguanylate cyclase (GGDEF)-like protein
MISSTTYSMATFVMVAFIQVVSMFGLMLISAERLQFRLHELAQSDPLTGLLNRRGFKLQSEVAIKRRRQGDNICAIMAFDLDHFKLINDSFGHATGDDVLIAFADCLKDNTRSTDILARFGGEEFIVLCIDVDYADAKKTAKRISEFMAALTIQSKNGEDVSITVSIGLAMIEEDSPDLNLYLDTADTALYNAKARGRNKVVVAESSSQFSVVT